MESAIWHHGIAAFLTNLRYMTRKNDTIVPDLLADPFEERSKMVALEPLQLLGGAIPV